MSRTHNSRVERHFGLLVGGIFAAIGLWPLVWRQQGPRMWALVLAAGLVLSALVAPRILAPFYRVWMVLGNVLALINTRIVLAGVFYGVITPIGLAMRLLGHDPMRRRLDNAAESYRVRREPRPATHMLRQF